MNKRCKLITLLLVLAGLTAVQAQVYIRDRSFAACGAANLSVPASGESELKRLTVLPDKKILLAGNFFHDNADSVSMLLVRYLANGVLDTAGFGDDGILLTRVTLQSYLNNIVPYPDNKLLAVGHENNTRFPSGNIPAVYRFTQGGVFDSTFNGNGVVTTRFDDVSAGSLHTAILLSNERIAAAGIATKNDGNGVEGIGIMQLKNNGELDSLFGNLPLHPGRSLLVLDSVKAIHLLEMSGNLVIPFVRRVAMSDTIFIAKLLPGGNIDNSFGLNGIASTGKASSNLSAIRQQDGKLLIGGTSIEEGEPHRIQLLRFTSTLLPDTDFGVNGYVIVPPVDNAGNDNVLDELVQQDDGKILIIGHTAPTDQPANVRPFILRLLDNGNVDSSFNGTGAMPVVTELLSGWNTIGATDNAGVLISRDPTFELLKYVPDTTTFSNDVTADFSFTVEKQMVFFTERSVNGEYFYWDFGDGEFSTQASPSHQYALPGNYLVTLFVSGRCDGQTVQKTVFSNGIYKIEPSTAPDRGFTLSHIYGYGFDPASRVFLTKGSVTQTATTVFFDAASHTLQANFRFVGADTGRYDLVVITGSRADTLLQCFEIRPAEMGRPWVQLVGPYNRSWNVARGERINTYRLEYGVEGNATQYLIPLGLVVGGNNLRVEMLTAVTNKGDTVNLPDSMKPHYSGLYRKYDAVTGDSVWLFLGLDHVVEANMTHALEFQVITTTMEGDFAIKGYIGKSMFDKEQLDTIYSRPASGFCDNKCISCLFGLAGFVPGPIGCFASILSTGCSVSNFINSPAQQNYAGVVNLAIGFAGTALSCGTMTGTSFVELLDEVGKNLLSISLSLPGSIIEDCVSGALNVIATGSCGGSGDEDGGRFKRTGSFDPNIKTGPAGYNLRHYIHSNEPLVYTIEFENLSTATAPAFQVTVTDTLDKSTLDIASFRFTGVNIANVNYPNFTAQDSFAMDIPMPEKGIVVRVNGKVDTVTGVVQWHFVSLDAITMQLVNDQANGFLPPNLDSVSGKGRLSFTVKQKKSNAHLTAISNKASIVFDFNAPVITPVFTNIVDTVKPQSQVLNQFRVLTDSTFSVRWTGIDADAGVRNYRIYMSENGSNYKLIGVYGIDSTILQGTEGSLYQFVSIAVDSVDNVEEPPFDAIHNPDAVFIFTAPLPVYLLSFSASKQNGSSLLKWSTSSEVNSSQFVVEHSADGARYAALSSVAAAGNSNVPTDYHYTHRQPLPGANYYRLKMIDKDGTFDYSPVRQLHFEQDNALKIIPNPATDRVFVYVEKPGGTIRLFSSIGKLLREAKLTQNQLEIDISAAAAGVYFITYSIPGDGIRGKKLLVVKRF